MSSSSCKDQPKGPAWSQAAVPSSSSVTPSTQTFDLIVAQLPHIALRPAQIAPATQTPHVETPPARSVQSCTATHPKRKKPCRFYTATGRCRRSDACPFSHSIDKRNVEQTPTAESTPAPSSPPDLLIQVAQSHAQDHARVSRKGKKSPRRHCATFKQTGSCQYDINCRYAHVQEIKDKTDGIENSKGGTNHICHANTERDKNKLSASHEQSAIHSDNIMTQVAAMSAEELRSRELTQLTRLLRNQLSIESQAYTQPASPGSESGTKDGVKGDTNADCLKIDVLNIKFTPTDPDWVFDTMRLFNVQITLLPGYPVTPFEVEIVNTNIDAKFLAVLNASLREYVNMNYKDWARKHQTVVRIFLKWLDRSLEALLVNSHREMKRLASLNASGLSFVHHTKLKPRGVEVGTVTPAVDCPKDTSSSASVLEAVKDNQVTEARTQGVRGVAVNLVGLQLAGIGIARLQTFACTMACSRCSQRFDLILRTPHAQPIRRTGLAASQLNTHGESTSLSEAPKEQEKEQSGNGNIAIQSLIDDGNDMGADTTSIRATTSFHNDNQNLHVENTNIAAPESQPDEPPQISEAMLRTNMLSSECERCSYPHTAVFHGKLIHEMSTLVGHLELVGCTAFDCLLGEWQWVVSCLECGTDLPKVKNVVRGAAMRLRCRECHSAMSLTTEGIKLGRAMASAIAGSLSAESTKTTNVKSKTLDRGKGGAALVVGEPLPKTGTCKHYAKSNRWLRFACCGKVYPCDVCHDIAVNGEHPMEWATRMICGFCSREQPYAKKANCVCGNSVTMKYTRHWNGGKGMRDKMHMSTKDAAKYRNSKAKTHSKKDERVGKQP
eukprot:CFRG5355T1